MTLRRFEWQRAVVNASDLSALAKHTALTLAVHMRGDVVPPECWPAVPTLARAMSRDKRSVYRGLQELERLAWIYVEHGGGRNWTNRYIAQLPEENGDTTPPFEDAGGAETVTAVRETVTAVHLNGDSHARNGDTVSPEVVEVFEEGESKRAISGAGVLLPSFKKLDEHADLPPWNSLDGAVAVLLRHLKHADARTGGTLRKLALAPDTYYDALDEVRKQKPYPTDDVAELMQILSRQGGRSR